MRFKPSEALRFLGGLAAAFLVLGFVVLRVTSCAPTPPPVGAPPGPPPAAAPPGPPPPPAVIEARCAHGREAAARANAALLSTLSWAPFRRPEVGWETYAPLIAREIATACPPNSPAFAEALAVWEARQGLPVDGVLAPDDFDRMKGVMLMRRPFVRLSAQKICPDPPPEAALETATAREGYSGKIVALQPAALAAWRRMAAAARAQDRRIAADPRNLTIFSGYRSPDSDAERCAREGNCDGVTRARSCSPHRTGYALDIYVGQAPGFGPDSTADPNRLAMSRTPTYRWLVAHADSFGFVNYPFEPWHWEWIGGAH